MLKYEYMVVYQFQAGFGRICITLEKKIEEYKDIIFVDTYLQENNPELIDLIVTDFKLLRVYESPEVKTE